MQGNQHDTCHLLAVHVLSLHTRHLLAVHVLSLHTRHLLAVHVLSLHACYLLAVHVLSLRTRRSLELLSYQREPTDGVLCQ